MHVYYINIVSECNLSVQVEYEVLRGPISAKNDRNFDQNNYFSPHARDSIAAGIFVFYPLVAEIFHFL